MSQTQTKRQPLTRTLADQQEAIRRDFIARQPYPRGPGLAQRRRKIRRRLRKIEYSPFHDRRRFELMLEILQRCRDHLGDDIEQETEMIAFLQRGYY